MRTENGIHVLEIKGRLNLGTTLTFLEIDIKKAIEAGVKQLVLDVSNLDYIDSAGIGMLMNTWGLMAKGGGRFVVAGATGVVAESFNVVHIHKVVPLYPTLAEALASYNS